MNLKIRPRFPIPSRTAAYQKLAPQPLGADNFHGNRSTLRRAHPPSRRPAVARRPGHHLSLAQAALAARHHPHRRLPPRAPALELRGPQRPLAYGAQVKFLNSLPLVRVLEWVFIFLPILYHGLYGVWIWLRGKSNLVYYPWAGNWMYTAQRYTGLIAFALHCPARLPPALHGRQPA